MSEDIHEVYAIRYGHHPRPAAENYIGGDPHDVLQPLDYYVWAIVGAAGTIILDTGFDEAVGTRRGRQTVHPVREGLATIGIDPDRVANVIVSHLHYDHCGHVPRPCRIPRRRRRDRARRHGAPHRRSRQGFAMRAREDAARQRRAGVRLHALLRPHG
jgi:glyoxylase-like metal-dependent hydrolase (beta-lactamase superfamily II)